MKGRATESSTRLDESLWKVNSSGTGAGCYPVGIHCGVSFEYSAFR